MSPCTSVLTSSRSWTRYSLSAMRLRKASLSSVASGFPPVVQVPVDKAEVAGQNAVGERNIAAHHGVLDLLLKRKNLGCGGRLVCSDRLGFLARAGPPA